jgi:hypothetical protein
MPTERFQFTGVGGHQLAASLDLPEHEPLIAMEGALDAEQRRKLIEVADKCPVHRTLTSEIQIVTRAAD